ncbi:MAG TPA: alcohol dehydrogenase catalytic domain-containing protein [Actinomycetota bacterium]|nr:alcohol dehydrogenase catalytic domain-containing protein [Actinomycetota bacterium]
MRAVVFTGNGVTVDDVPEPQIEETTDAIVAVKKTAICASDLHLLNGKTPGMREGGVIGHEFVGHVVRLGKDVSRHHEDTRVLGSFLIACGECTSCLARRFNHCKNRRALGLGTLTGDLDGAQAELVRVPQADLNLRTLSGGLAGLTEEEALFGGDVLATGFYAASLAGIERDETVVVIGAGPVGMFCAAAARRYNPARVLIVDTDPKRAQFASDKLGLEALDVSSSDAEAAIGDATGGEMADVAIEAVGSIEALKSAMKCVRDGGRVAVVGVYGTERYDLPMGRVWIRGLDLRFAGMANVQGHWDDALLAVAKGDLDPTAVITHRLALDDAEKGYELFASREATKVVLTP